MTDTDQATTADTEAEPVPVAEARLVPAHLAGAGLPGTAFDAARAAGWLFAQDNDANVCAVSDDGDLHLQWLPEVNPGPLWVIVHSAEPAWRITADDQTPAEFIAALITAITTTGPLDPDRDRA